MLVRPIAIAAALIAPAAAYAQAAPIGQFDRRYVIEQAARVADWQLARLNDQRAVSRVTGDTANPRAWEQAAFWVGMTEFADAGAPPRMKEAVISMGRRNQWLPGDRPFFADDHAITQSYLWAAERGAGPTARQPTKRLFDRILAKPPVTTLAFYVPPGGYNEAECLKRWCWCDAIFMAPPAFLKLSLQTGDPRYRNFAIREFWATTDFLFDPVEKLYYRDSRFFERRDAKGRKQFWSRGNGWAFAGMARMIPMMPQGPERRRVEALFKEMAARLKQLQKPDGYWAPSLLAPEGSPPESSGTGFFTYGIAWGINAGLLDRREYEPVVRRGWSGLVRAIQPDGRLGWVQQVSDRPEAVAATDTQYYGVGAFLLAASAINRLDGAKPPRR